MFALGRTERPVEGRHTDRFREAGAGLDRIRPGARFATARG
jgi:hypothetical protein